MKGYYENQVFLNRVLIEDAKIPLEDIQKKVSRFLVQFSGMLSAYPYSAFEANDFGNGHLKRIVYSFSPQRSGDVIITLNPAWIEKGDYVANHNSPYEYDSHVPLIWYGGGDQGNSLEKGKYYRHSSNSILSLQSSVSKCMYRGASYRIGALEQLFIPYIA